MRKTILQITPSLTASIKTQMVCMAISSDVNVKYYFIEYPTNLPPNHYNLEIKGNNVIEVNKDTYGILFNAFKLFQEIRTEYPFIHSPTFILSYCLGAGVDVKNLGILL